MPEPTHACPAPGCTKQVPHNQLTCRGHWFSVPQEIRSRLWSAYRSNDGARHAQAMADCISFLKAKAAPANGGHG